MGETDQGNGRSFHEVKIIHTTRGQKKRGKKKKSHFSMAKQPPLDGTQTCGIGLKVVTFLTTPLNRGKTLSV